MARKSSNDVVKSIPSTESGAATECINADGKVFYITSNPITGKFTLWDVLPDGFKRLSVADNPLKFDSIIYQTK